MLSICSQYTLHTTFRLFGNLLNILNIIKTFKGLPNPKNTKSLAETFWVVFKSRLPVYTHSKNHNAPAVFLKPYSAHLSTNDIYSLRSCLVRYICRNSLRAGVIHNKHITAEYTSSVLLTFRLSVCLLLHIH